MKNKKFIKRKIKVKSKIKGSKDRLRLSVYRSNKNLFAQIVDDKKGITLVSISTSNLKGDEKDRVKKALLLGEELAKKALTKKISKVSFDRSGYRFHGRVKALADGARKGGLKF